jgi:hypothetical protein
VNRPVSVEWFGRSTEVIRYSPKLDDFPEGIFTTVYKHDFPGSTLWCVARAYTRALPQRTVLVCWPSHLSPSPLFLPSGWTFGTA